MNKTLSFLVSFILTVSMLMYSNNAEASDSFEMEIFPRQAGIAATYIFKFTAEKKLEPLQWVRLGFPRGTVMPPLPEERRERGIALMHIMESIGMGYPGRIISCPARQGVPIVTFYDDGTLESIQFNICCATLDPEDEKRNIAIYVVPDILGIKTPAEEGFFEYRISNQSEPTQKTTLVEIVESQIGVPSGIPQVKVNPPVAYYTAGYEIQFNVGRGGRLQRGRGVIDVRFPEGSSFTKPLDTMDLNDITINDSALLVSPENISDPSSGFLRFILPVPIRDSEQVTLRIAPSVGIRTPPATGSYQWEVRTSFDDWVFSKETALVEAKDYVSLSAIPSTIGRISTYTVRFIPQISIPQESTLSLHFPEELQFDEDLMQVYLDDDLVPYHFDDSTLSITNSHQNLDRGSLCQIRVTSIINPAKPQTLQVKLSLPDHPDRLSMPLDIVKQRLEINDFEVFPPNANELADYRIEILFNDDQYPSKDDVLTIDLGFDNQTFERPMDHLEDIEPLTVSLLDLKNPDAGDYVLTVSLLGESIQLPFTILPALPSSKIEILPLTSKDWWTSPPTVSLESSDWAATIYYWWNDQEEEISKYTRPITLEPGQYKSIIRYYAETEHGREKTNFKEIWVDTIPPEVEVISPLSEETITHQAEFEISARMVQTQLLLYGKDTRYFYDTNARINGVRVTVDQKDGSFIKTVKLDEGENIILIEVEDDAGNLWSREYTVTLDTVVPEITFTHPKNMATLVHRDREVLIQGSLSKPAELLIDGIIAYVDADGNFKHAYTAFKGLNEVMFQATDRAGNVVQKTLAFYFGYTIQLQIGKQQALVNDKPEEMLLAPFIEAGRTLLPFRFIGESLGASVGFTLDPQTRLVFTVSYRLEDDFIVLAIGNTLAEVNGLPVSLDVAPKIINGTTVVPLRFIAENLGCQVEWEATKQLITIFYPK